MRRLPDGGLEWTTPSGDRVTTHPPSYGTDDPPPSSGSPPDRSPKGGESVFGRPDQDGSADDPPPF